MEQNAETRASLGQLVSLETFDPPDYYCLQLSVANRVVEVYWLQPNLFECCWSVKFKTHLCFTFFWLKNNDFVFTSSSINICCWRKWSHSFFKLSPKSSSIKSPSPPVFARADCSSGSSSGATVVSSSVVSLATSKREKKNQKYF